MYCIYCGKHLPDGAKFCYNCGKEAFRKEDSTPAEEPNDVIEEEPVSEPIYEAPQEEEPVCEPHNASTKTPKFSIPKPKKPREPLTPQKKKIIAIVAAIVVVIVVAIVAAISAVSGASKSDDKTMIPDPEYYFSLPISDTEESDGLVTYTLYANNDDDLRPVVYAYIDTISNDYGFLINNNDEDEDHINCHLMGFDDDEYLGEVQVIYLHDSYNHMIVIRTTSNIGIVSGVGYNYSANTTPDETTHDETTHDETTHDEINSDEITTDVESVQSEYSTGNPAVLPDFAEFDSTGTFSYSTAFFASTRYDVDRLYFSYSSKDVNAVYQVNSYVEMLYDLGWQLEFIDEDNSVYLYHSDVAAPSLPDAEKAQIFVQAHVNSTGDTAFVSFMMPEEICIKNYEDKWQWNVEWREKREAEKAREEASSSGSSSGSGSGSSSSSGSSSFNKDLYDNDPICGVCHGDGDCSKCGGDGYLHSSASDEEDRNCYKCSGSGRCGSCGGDGRL